MLNVRRIHSGYLGEKILTRDMSEFEICEFFTISSADKRAIRIDSPTKTRLALALLRRASTASRQWLAQRQAFRPPEYRRLRWIDISEIS